MNLEHLYTELIVNGYGRYSRDILDHMCSMVQEIVAAKNNLKPNDQDFIIKVAPNTKVTVKIECL